MKSKYLRPFCLTLAVLFPIFGEAREDQLVLPLPRKPHTFYTELNTDYFLTKENYSYRFTVEPLGQTSIQSRRQPFFYYTSFDLSVGYSLNKQFEMDAFVRGFWFAESDNGINTSFQSPYFARGGVSLRHHQKLHYVILVPSVNFSFPFYLINFNSQLPITQDGSLHFTPAFWLYAPIKNLFYPFGYLGFKFRTNFLSSLLRWKLGALLTISGLEVGLQFQGFWSVILDQSSSRLGDKRALLDRVNGGSLKFFSSNPGVLNLGGWVGWRFSHFILRLMGDVDMFGQNYAKGSRVLFSVIMEIGKNKRAKRRSQIYDRDEGRTNFETEITKEEESVIEIFQSPPVEEHHIQEEVEQALEEKEREQEKMIKEK